VERICEQYLRQTSLQQFELAFLGSLLRQKSVNFRTFRRRATIRAQLSSAFTIAFQCLRKKCA